MPAHMKLLIVLVAALALVVAGCVKKRAIPTSPMDSPGYHYSNGITSLDNDRVDDAMTSFERAVALDPGSPLGYIGRGLAFGRKGEFKSAFENMLQAKDLDRGSEASLGMIRLYSMQRAKT